MSDHSRKRADAYVAAYNARDIEGVCTGLTGSTSLSLAGGMFVFPDLSAWRGHHQNEWNAFPDARFEVTATWPDAGACTIEGIWHGTMENAFVVPGMPPLPPTGRRTDLPCAIVVEADEGGTKRITGYWNSLVAMSELGLMPEP